MSFELRAGEGNVVNTIVKLGRAVFGVLCVLIPPCVSHEMNNEWRGRSIFFEEEMNMFSFLLSPKDLWVNLPRMILSR